MSATEDRPSPVARSVARRQEWPAHPGVLAEIRTAVGSWLAGFDLSPNLRADLVYATSEAASNAVEHAYRSPDEIRVVVITTWTDAGSVNIEIADQGRWLPAPSEPTTRGRGLRLMRGLVDSVDIDTRATGTTVSLRHPLSRVAAARNEPACGS